MIAAQNEVTIGDHTMFANGCFVGDAEHRYDDPETPVTRQGFASKGPVRIGSNCWFGVNCVVTSGVTIGDRCVIGANSVVTEDLPPGTIAAGAPPVQGDRVGSEMGRRSMPRMSDEAPEQEKLTLWQRLGVREIRRAAGQGARRAPRRRGLGGGLRGREGPGPAHGARALETPAQQPPLRALRRAVRRLGPLRRAAARLPALAQEPDDLRHLRRDLAAGRDEDAGRGALRRPARLHRQQRGRRPGGGLAVLRRFYRCAEDVLFPEAVIDKLIGDEVMALYLPHVQMRFDEDEVPALMLEHGRELLRAVGYGSAEGPFVEMGIGIDFGEAFVGNIGERALYDFTAVGDVVNTASRLQGEAAGGEIVISRARRRGPARAGRHPGGAHPQGKERASGRLPRDDLRLSSLRTPAEASPTESGSQSHAFCEVRLSWSR